MTEPGARELGAQRTLAGAVDLDLGDALVQALKKAPTPISGSFVIALDTNALHNVSLQRDQGQIVEYLRQDHSGALILPGQALIEFWNHRIVDLSRRGRGVYSTINKLVDELKKLSTDLGETLADAVDAVEELRSSLPVGMDPQVRALVESNLALLVNAATVPFALRDGLDQLADARQARSVPPGFMDKSHGDFFVWCDLVAGVARLLDQGVSVSGVVLVTDDSKQDWSLEGIAHPYLVAEMRAALDLEFEVWSVARLATHVDGFTSGD